MNGIASPDATTSGSAKSHNRKNLDHSSVKAEVNGDKNVGIDGDSEAETLITSPVKQKEAAKKNSATIHSENAVNNNVKQRLDLDENADANGSSEDELTIPARKASSASAPNNDFSEEEDSDSDISSHESADERAWNQNATRNGASSPNPRKRKHRASSISLPNKRPSIDGARRRLRGSEGPSNNGRSESPRNRGHRRAASTQSFLENEPTKKRRSGNNISGRRTEWEESSVSSEATSHGQHDQRRPQRGVGRATTTPGRPAGREHKRYQNRYGFTRLAEACESGDLDAVKEWRTKDPDQVEMAEYAGNKPLQIAALAGNVEVVKYLIDEGCRIDCANDVHDTPLIDAAENGHLDVVEVLLKAGVNPCRKSGKGQQALDVVNDDTENATEIRAALRTAMESWDNTDQTASREEEERQQRFRAGPAKALEILGRTPEVLQQLVAINDRNGVQECLDARVPVDNAIITSAAKTGDIYLLNMLLAEMTDKKRHQKPEKPLLGVIGTSHFEMVKALTELEQFRPLWTNRQDQKWSEIAEEKAGPNCKQEVELFRRLEKQAETNADDKRSSSPVVNRSTHKQKRTSISKDADGTDEAMEDATPRQRKNGRRLMSKKDIRAANGKHVGSSDESESDDARENVRPAVTTEKRGPGRPKSKPVSIKNEDDKEPENSRRPSVSLKSGNDRSLASVPEAVEENSTAPSASDAMDVDIAEPQGKPSATKRSQKTTPSTSKFEKDNTGADDGEVAKQQAEIARQLSAEQEQARLELEKREAEARQKEAEIKKKEAEAKLKEEAEAKKRAEELEKKKQEEAKRFADIEQGKTEARQKVVESLPGVLSAMLDTRSQFTLQDNDSVDALLEFCEPLQVVYPSDCATRDFEHDQHQPMVLNIAVAPLLGKDLGLFTLLPEDMLPAGQATVSQNLPGVPLEEEERVHVVGLIRDGSLSRSLLHQREPEHVGDDHNMSFQQQMAVSAALMNRRREIVKKLESSAFVYRWLPLQEVLDMLHPALRNLNIRVREDWRNHLRQKLRPALETPDEDFFARVKHGWSAPHTQYYVRHGQAIGQQQPSSFHGSTAVQVIHSK